MKIGFDAKRAVSNNTGLGNYSRLVIDVLTEFYPDEEYRLYTPKIKEQPPDRATRPTRRDACTSCYRLRQSYAGTVASGERHCERLYAR